MKTQFNFLVAIAAVCTLFLSSCVSMTSMQTARTLGKGNTEAAIGASRVGYEFVTDVDTFERKSVTGEVDVRYGVIDKLDVGIKVSLIGTSGGYAKYQFLGDEESPIAASAGLGLAFLTIESGEGEFASKSRTTDFSIPLFFSYHPNEWLGIYATPRYTLRNISNSDSGSSESFTSHWYGVTTGIRLGKRIAPFFEYSIFNSGDATQPLSQITGGVSIGF